MSNVIDMRPVMLAPAMVEAINEEMAASGAREIQLALEIAKLHGVISGMRHYCELAVADCMLPRSVQAARLNKAIALADGAIGKESG